MTDTLTTAAESLRRAITDASRGLVERDVLVESVALAAVAGEHVLVIGPPGTAKSEAVRRIARALGGRYFEYLLGRFTEPSEIFGPVDLRRLREGVVETVTEGMLPEAEIAFVDEVFLGSTAILNTLLTLLNERTFRRGRTSVSSPLRVCVGASNTLPTDPALAAFADRFLVHVFVDPIGDPSLEDLLEAGWEAERAPVTPAADLSALDTLSAAARDVDMAPIRRPLAEAIRRLRGAGVALSDRRVVKTQRLVAAAAVVAGRSEPTAADLWPIVHSVPTREGQDLAREALGDLLQHAESAAMPAAALEASLGPRARAAELLRIGGALLDAGDETEAWRLRLEGVAREIDASFAAEQLTDELRAMRERIVTRLP